MTAAILLTFFTKMFFLLKVSIEIHYIVIANCILNLSLLYQCTQDGKTYKKTCMGHFDPFRRSGKFKFSTVLMLRIGNRPAALLVNFLSKVWKDEVVNNNLKR